MRINCSISTIDEEAKFTKTTTIADKFINVCMSFRVSCALECEICKMSALSFFNSFCKSFDSFVLCEVYGYFSVTVRAFRQKLLAQSLSVCPRKSIRIG